ncbi:hypothetical protein CAPTEDRAFT_49592, partial [Capitella teleta]
SLSHSRIILCRKLDVLQKTADEIQEKTGNKVKAIATDVREPGSEIEVVSECIEEMGLPHLVVN